jgi:predicted nucleic acid-binding protein
LTGIADVIEGHLENINLSLYPITERVIADSRTTVFEMECSNAADALHVYIAKKANCHYFVTADEGLANILKKSSNPNLIAIHIGTEYDLLVLFTALE